MPSSASRILFVPDTHAPYHDARAWDLMLKAAKSFCPDVIVHLGDLADFYKVSSHSKDPAREYSFKDEIGVARKLRGQLDRLGASRKIFICGNHEDRLPRYLAEKAPELHDEISIDSLLKLSDNGWEIVPYRSSIKLGKLYITHDVGTAGKYSTARALETFQHSVAIGHHHAVQYQVAGDATGQYQVGAQFGWLGDINRVDYMHKVRVQRLWSLGFGIGYWDRDTGIVYVVPVPVVKYSCCLEGRVFRG